MKIREILQQKREEILNLAAQHGASNIRIFGSVARDEEGEDSDIDFLVDMESDRSLLDRIGLIQDLEDILGRKVDVATVKGLR
jgi:predicted nucleotidyltransferase